LLLLVQICNCNVFMVSSKKGYQTVASGKSIDDPSGRIVRPQHRVIIFNFKDTVVTLLRISIRGCLKQIGQQFGETAKFSSSHGPPTAFARESRDLVPLPLRMPGSARRSG